MPSKKWGPLPNRRRGARRGVTCQRRQTHRATEASGPAPVAATEPQVLSRQQRGERQHETVDHVPGERRRQQIRFGSSDGRPRIRDVEEDWPPPPCGGFDRDGDRRIGNDASPCAVFVRGHGQHLGRPNGHEFVERKARLREQRTTPVPAFAFRAVYSRQEHDGEMSQTVRRIGHNTVPGSEAGGSARCTKASSRAGVLTDGTIL